MRRFAVVVVAALLLAALAAGCGTSLPSEATGTFTPRHAGVLTVATNLPAPGFWEGSSAATVHGGFEYGIALRMADRFHLGRVRVVDQPFTGITSGSLAGGADLALAQVTITAERERRERFSIPYWNANLGVLVRPGTQVPDLATARARHWAYQVGTTSQAFVATVIRPSHPARGYAGLDQLLAALRGGTVDAVLLDLPLGLVEAKDSHGRLEVVAQFVTGERYGAVLPKDSPNREAVDSALRGMQADGTIAALADRWLVPAFGQDPDTVPVIQFSS
jgi:polar amino acid transport system substrate-binding protein